MRMSSGPSRMNEKPRPGSSTCMLDMPRSATRPSTRRSPSAASTPGSPAKLPWWSANGNPTASSFASASGEVGGVEVEGDQLARRADAASVARRCVRRTRGCNRRRRGRVAGQDREDFGEHHGAVFAGAGGSFAAFAGRGAFGSRGFGLWYGLPRGDRRGIGQLRDAQGAADEFSRPVVVRASLSQPDASDGARYARRLALWAAESFRSPCVGRLAGGQSHPTGKLGWNNGTATCSMACCAAS